MNTLSTLLASTFAAVFLAEVVGDKTLYTTGVLAGAHRSAPVALGASVAAALKMAVAVLAGGLVQHLPLAVRIGVCGCTWLGLALSALRSGPEPREQVVPVSAQRLAGLSFTAVFLTEWGDPGQLSAALLAARFQAPLAVWAAATAAMTVKIGIGVAMARFLQDRLPRRAFQLGGAALFLVFGAFTLLGWDQVSPGE